MLKRDYNGNVHDIHYHELTLPSGDKHKCSQKAHATATLPSAESEKRFLRAVMLTKSQAVKQNTVALSELGRKKLKL